MPRDSAASAIEASRARLTALVHEAVIATARSEWMRAPGEASGLLAIECAMDELAVRLGIDPVELRRRNKPEADPTTGKPFAERRLLACIDEATRHFDWEARPPAPRGRRQGELFLGQGFAGAIRPNLIRPAEARVTWDATGRCGWRPT